MATLTIAELPFLERPVIELLNFDDQRTEVDVDYAGYGWARVDRLWLAGAHDERAIDDAVVLALHSADDGEPLADDVELEFELPGRASVTVLASAFLERWLPRLPSAPHVVLAMCNPHRAVLRPRGTAVVHYAQGDVESWLADEDPPDRDARILLAAETWCTLAP